MRALVADKFEESGLEGLRELGVEVLYQPDLKDDSLVQALRESGAEVLIVRSTKVTEPMIEASRLGLIIRAGAGYNTIDVEAASRRGILVSNCPGKNAQAVAELAFGLLIACDRRIPSNAIMFREGRWNKKGFSRAKGLFGRTLGLIGMGNISQEMIPRAKAFGMSIVAFSRWMTPETAEALGVERAESLEDLARRSDFVSVHVSLTPETRGMLGTAFFEALPANAIFVNTSRAEVVDENALLAAVDQQGVIAGVDVFAGEPAGGDGEVSSPLQEREAVFVTHHVGASTDQAQEAVAGEVVRIVREQIENGQAPNVVNVKRAEIATHLLVVRHRDEVGVLAYVLDVLRKENVSIQEMENVVLRGAQAAIAQLACDKSPSPGALAAIGANPAVFDVALVPIRK